MRTPLPRERSGVPWKAPTRRVHTHTCEHAHVRTREDPSPAGSTVPPGGGIPDGRVLARIPLLATSETRESVHE
jgi:hypothetical protein